MRFMLKLTLNRSTSEEIMALLSAEQRRGKELTEQGIRKAVWQAWNCDSEEVLEEMTKTLPLYEFWNIEVTRLAARDF